MKDILSHDPSPEGIKQRQEVITANRDLLPDLFRFSHLPIDQVAKKNCENLIGSIVLPVGVVGPLVFQFAEQTHSVFAPLATTEGALVASVNRGARTMSESQTSVFVGVSRAPVFSLGSGGQALDFTKWISQHTEEIKIIAEGTSSHLKYLSHMSWVRGRHAYVRFVFDTSDAMGMNMVTIATSAIADFLEKQFEGARLVSISSNVCTDKKDAAINQLLGRGYWVQAESWIAHTVIRGLLHIEPEVMVDTHIQKNLVGSNVAGSLSQNGHVANVIAALYLATGQDPAHIVDGSRAALTIENQRDYVYAALTLPSVLVGTVGGGTSLPAQQQARLLIGHGEEITPSFLAAVIGISALAGELSLLASLSENSLASAHSRLARSK